MKKLLCVLLTLFFTMPFMISRETGSGKNQEVKEVLTESRDYTILKEVVDSAKDEYDIDESIIWIKDRKTGKETRLLQTVRPDWHFWYMTDGSEFYEVPIDSILVAHEAHIIQEDPLQIIIEGVPDCRNVFSYLIDVPSRKAWYVPANMGYLGSTSEEGFLVFQSYRYVSDPEVAGRYTFLQIFDPKEGILVDSLDLERHHLVGR